MEQGLAATAGQWVELEIAYDWVHQAAHVLGDPAEQPVEERRRRYRGVLATMSRERERAGSLAPAVAHFVKVSKSYWRGLFCCYEYPELPRTNNDLEQTFGVVRHLERRTTGRKGASPGLVVRGSVRVIAVLATRRQRFSGADLAVRDPAALRQVREELAERAEARRAQRRFRRNPLDYLRQAADLLIGATLPP